MRVPALILIISALLVIPSAIPSPTGAMVQDPSLVDATFSFSWMAPGERFNYRVTGPSGSWDFSVIVAASSGGKLDTRWVFWNGTAVAKAEFTISTRQIVTGAGAYAYAWINSGALQALNATLAHDNYAYSGLSLDGYVFDQYGSKFTFDAAAGFLKRAENADRGLSIVLISRASGSPVPAPNLGGNLQPNGTPSSSALSSNDETRCLLPISGPMVNPLLPSNGVMVKECRDSAISIDNQANSQGYFPPFATGIGRYEVRHLGDSQIAISGRCQASLPFYVNLNGEQYGDMTCPPVTIVNPIRQGDNYFVRVDGRDLETCLVPSELGFKCVWEARLRDIVP